MKLKMCDSPEWQKKLQTFYQQHPVSRFIVANIVVELLLIALIMQLLTSCDDRFEFLSSVNASPVITISRTGVESEDPAVLNDAVKTSLKYNNLPYVIQLKASDKETMISSIDYRFVTGNGSIQQSGQALNGSIALTAGAAAVSFQPQDVGRVVIEFFIEDDFKRKAIATADLEVFVNQPPIAHLTSQFIGTHGPYEYRLDAGGSFDQDKNEGGEIKAYHFIINDTYHITTTQPTVTHSFEGPGPERRDVKLEVIDNDGAKSDLFPLVVVK